jgi:hypothetical protein
VIEYQPNGLTKPVFFKTYRSDVSGLVDFFAMQAYRQVTVEILAEPFAVGLRESFSGTFGFDPASTGYETTLGPILGDSPAPLVLELAYTASAPFALNALSTPNGLAASTLVRKVTNGSFSAGSGVTPVTGAGTGYWNGDYYAVNCAIGVGAPLTDINNRRLLFSHSLPAGVWRAVAQMSFDGTGTYQAQISQTVATASPVLQVGTLISIPAGPIIASPYDMGIFSIPFGAPEGTAAGVSYFALNLTRQSGAGDAKIDGVIFYPVGSGNQQLVSTLLVDPPNPGAAFVVDAGTGAVYQGVYGGAIAGQQSFLTSGGAPWVAPACTNSVRLIPLTPTATNTAAIGYTGSYDPRYSHIRPIAS